MRRFVAFVPEVIPESDRKKKLSDGLFLLSSKNKLALALRAEIEAAGYSITGGAYLYFEGKIKEDATPYEIFYGYCLALTFFYKEGLATCRAVKELVPSEKAQFFIDKFDQFRIDPDDIINFRNKNTRGINSCYRKIIPLLATKKFNPLRNTLEFFALFSKEYEIRVRLLYLSICLESLFLEGGDTEGIAYKLGTRCSAFLGHFDKDIDSTSTFLEVKTAYNLRSKIIHGGDYQKESARAIRGITSKATSELDHILILEKILKNTLHYIFLNEDFYIASQDKSLGTEIDEKLILKRFD